MKKLLFATAIAASAAAFATDPFNAISFENYSLGATFANGATENNEFAKTASEKYFYFDGDSNSSVVTNDSPVLPAATRPKYFADNPGTGNYNYLALDTEGGTFWRSINDITNETTTVGEQETTTYGLGAAQAVGDGIYLDTMVQFTVTEDEEPTVNSGDKLAIWLQAGEGTTNLMVKAKGWTLNLSGEPEGIATSFTVTGVTVDPGVWYRLTVKAIQSVVDASQTMIYLPAFEIFIDGTPVAAAAPQFSAELQAAFANYYVAGMGELVAANKLFPTLAEIPASVADITLQGVGFQGTGAIDDLVLTEEDPFAGAAPTTVDFTLTGGANATVTYVFGETSDTWDGTSDPIAIPQGTNVTFTATPGSGFTYVGVDLTDTPWTLNGTAITTTFSAVDTDTALTVPDAIAVVTYPTYVGEDATLKSQYDTWKGTNGADSESAYEKQFLLNVAPSTTVADDALVIESITESATAGAWDIVVSTTVTGAALSADGETTYNGYLLVKAANDLASLESATPTAYTVTAVTGGKVKITVTAGKFMKAVLTTTAPTPAAGN